MLYPVEPGDALLAFVLLLLIPYAIVRLLANRLGEASRNSVGLSGLATTFSATSASGGWAAARKASSACSRVWGLAEASAAMTVSLSKARLSPNWVASDNARSRVISSFWAKAASSWGETGHNGKRSAG